MGQLMSMLDSLGKGLPLQSRDRRGQQEQQQGRQAEVSHWQVVAPGPQ
jgi:hypothetical protein